MRMGVVDSDSSHFSCVAFCGGDRPCGIRDERSRHIHVRFGPSSLRRHGLPRRDAWSPRREEVMALARASLLAVTLLVMSGCAESEPKADGPLSIGDGEGSICLEWNSGAGEFTFGNEVLSLKDGSRIRVTRIALEGARGVSCASRSLRRSRVGI